MVVVLTIKKTSYLVVGIFDEFCINIYKIKFSDCAICLVSGIATKAAMAFPNSITII